MCALLVLFGAIVLPPASDAAVDPPGHQVRKLAYVYNEVLCHRSHGMAGDEQCSLDENIIYVVDSPGSRPRQLAVGTTPVWSPDGSRIAYCRRNSFSGPSQIELVNADGTNPRRLTNTSGHACEPSWSPDGASLLYVEKGKGYSAEGTIYMVNPDDGKTVTIGVGRSPSWSPDSDRIAYQASNKIIVVNADGANPMLIGRGHSPRWSPDGSHLLFFGVRADHHPCSLFREPGITGDCSRLQGSIWVALPDGTELRKVYTVNDLPAGRFQPFWSPDSKSIVMPMKDGRAIKMFRINLDGSGLEKISNLPIQDFSILGLSPDGQRFVAIRESLPLGRSDTQLNEPTVVLIDPQHRAEVLAVGADPNILWQHN